MSAAARPIADVLAESRARVIARVDRMNRASYLAGQLSALELEGAIVLLEAALRDRRALVGLSPADADAGLAYMLPDGAW